ncbi:FecR family protein [Pedobacter nyackensis]|uniref:FecR family protein n=1 Tax=Pedobacter nyackensis TaxID=475255 RepID=UPI00292CE954|nr:FecR domain-containing protein [Pedobacter nyackensis]
MENNIAKSLLDKYTAGTCTDEELAKVEAWYAQWNQDLPDTLSEEKIQLALDRGYHRLPVAHKSPLIVKWRNWASAAAIILVTGLGVVFYKKRNSTGLSFSMVTIKDKDISPGSKRATLTLSDGKKINLSDAKTGVVIDINKLSYDDGTAISSTLSNKKEPIGNLSVSTPRGGTYQIVLPDGSKVWLNAASDLKFPNSFHSLATRTVKLTGEAYFEVSKNQNQPFIVETDQQNVKVLGTHFNINSYRDQKNTKTTLLEGSVQVATKTPKNIQEVILSPNQQSVLTGSTIHIQNANVKEAIAWKNGYFIFNGENLETIMQEISRWYDVQVIFEDNVQTVSFIGVISNSKNLSAVLQAIAETGNVHFRIEGRSVIVMK